MLVKGADKMEVMNAIRNGCEFKAQIVNALGSNRSGNHALSYHVGLTLVALVNAGLIRQVTGQMFHKYYIV